MASLLLREPERRLWIRPGDLIQHSAADDTFLLVLAVRASSVPGMWYMTMVSSKDVGIVEDSYKPGDIVVLVARH